ncbi:MAG: HD domain-containing protein, partial [Gemmatimonadota bacterium]
MSRDPGPGTIPDAVGVLRSFSLLRRQIALYPQGHAMTRQAVEEVVERLNDVFHDRHLLRIELVAGVIHTAGYPFRSESRAYREEIEELARLGIRCLEIDRTVQPGELVATAEVLHELGESGVGRRTLHRRLAERGVEHVRLVGLTPVDTRREGFRWPDAPSATASVAYREALDAGREVVGRVFEGGAPRAETVAALQARIYALVDDPTALGEILAVKRYDNHTFCHSVNVATLSLLIARQIGFDERTTAAIGEAALLHDIGK